MSNNTLNIDCYSGYREILFLNRQETNYPNLMRLCMDFEFQVLQLQPKLNSVTADMQIPATAFVLSSGDYLSKQTTNITPVCKSIKELEEYVAAHQIDILHTHLFGNEEEFYEHGEASFGANNSSIY